MTRARQDQKKNSPAASEPAAGEDGVFRRLPLRAMPLIVLTLSLGLGAKIYDGWGRGVALIDQAKAAASIEKPAVTAPAIAKPAIAGPAAPKLDQPAVKPAPASAAAPQSRTEAQIQAEIAARKAKVATASPDTDLRQRLIEAAEKRIDGKLGALKGLQGDLKRLTGERQEQVDKQFASLVKVYETMKPKDAARIMERLDLKVQLAVASRMKEQKMAAILANMDPEKARDLTMGLAAGAI